MGFYDRAIVGSGDSLMAHGLVGCDALLARRDAVYPAAMIAHYRRWADTAYDQIQGRVGYINGILYHLRHGRSAKRNYIKRLHKIRDLGYDPDRDLVPAANGLYQWDTDNIDLIEYVRNYFSNRDEDSIPSGLDLLVFGDGCYEDKGGFRWCRSSALFYVSQDTPNAVFRLANNALHHFTSSQTITINRNNQPVAEVKLQGNQPREVEIRRLVSGDNFHLHSDFEFSPTMFGAKDNRQLSFMLTVEVSDD